MLEKKDSASSGVMLLCSGSGGGSRSLDEEDANLAGTAVSSNSVQRQEQDATGTVSLDADAWCESVRHHESEDDDLDEERAETSSLLDHPTTDPSWQIPTINTPSHTSVDSDKKMIIPTEITYFDESGDKYCIKNASDKESKPISDNNLLIQDSGSQFLFPMDVSLVLEGGEEGATPSLSRVTSACSTVALEDEEALRQLTPGSTAAMVIGSAPAGPIGTNRGILQVHNGIRDRKNSQVCFREEDGDSPVTAGTPLLPNSLSPSTTDAPDHHVKAENEEEWELEPPDGGWGWLVLAGSVLVNILVPGTVKSFGVLFVEFLEVFQSTPVAASWIPALCYFLYSSLGPVASVLSAKFSYRTVTILGGGFAAFGMVLSYFANSIAYLYIRFKRALRGVGLLTNFGVLVGTGAGLAFPPGVFIVSSYFQRRRGLANGLCISGSAIGSIILPPLLRHLLNIYGYRGAVLIMGGITFNVWVGAMFYHPVERHMRRVRKQSCALPPKPKEDTVSDVAPPSSDASPLEIEGVKFSSPQLAMSQPISIPTADDPQQVHVPKDFMFYFEEGSPEHDAEYEKRWLAAQSSSFMGPNIDKASLEKSPSPLALRDVLENSKIDAAARLLANSEKKNWDVFSTLPASTQRVLRLSMRPSQSQAVAAALQKSSSSGTGQLSRSFSSNVSLSSFRYISTVHHGSTLAALQQNPPDNEFASTLTLRSVSQSCWESALECARAFCTCKCTRQEKDEKTPSSGKLTKNNNNTAEKIDDKSAANSSSKLLDLSLLKDSIYLVILLSNSTNAIGYTNFIILLPAYAISLGFDKSSASLLLSLVAALDLVGRIGGSALSDLHFVPRKYYYIGGLALSGAILAFIPLLATLGYTSVAISCAIFGLGSGTYVGVTAVLMADMLGAERLASSFGISLFVNGILQLLGPPVCGLALQEFQSYTPIFSTLGVVLLLGAAMWGFVPLIERKRKMDSQDVIV